ncbi:DUF5958 family protein [Chitinimonas sp.]|uniref:DUF5958 family protein n=1 Tax=Chitinimonas sp. TaxID=1934313 RepID=UPI0035B42CB5
MVVSMALTETQLIYNQIAQRQKPFGLGVAWFANLGESAQMDALQELRRVAQQSHPKATDLPEAMQLAGIKRAMTPCVMVSKVARPELAFDRLLKLPQSEWDKVFQLLLALFVIADSRRRETDCADGCTHEWHNLPT